MQTPAGDAISADGRPSREVTGRMVLVGLVAFFAAVAGVNAVMIWAAVSTFGGVDTESSYQAGLAFARETAAVAAQDALHWQGKAKGSGVAGATPVGGAAPRARRGPRARAPAGAPAP